MTNEELCLRYQFGDVDAGNELIENNTPFICSIVYELYNDNHQKKVSDEEDYMQIANMALIRSAERFDPSKGLKFLSYAGKAIRNAILDTIDAEARLSPDYEEVSIDKAAIEEKIADDGPVSMNIVQMRTQCQLPSTYDTYPEIIYLQKEKLEELHNAIETLPKRQKTWIIEHYGFNDENEPCSLAGMCRRYYITPISAKKLDNEALEMVSKKIGIKRPAKVYKQEKKEEAAEQKEEIQTGNEATIETAQAV